MIREIFVFIILGACLSLLGLFYLEPDLFTYQTIPDTYNGLINDIDTSIPTNPDEIKVKDKYPFIFWLIQHQYYIFSIMVLVAACNLYVGYKNNSPFWQYIRKVYKEQTK